MSFLPIFPSRLLVMLSSPNKSQGRIPLWGCKGQRPCVNGLIKRNRRFRHYAVRRTSRVTSCPLRKALIMLFRGEMSKHICKGVCGDRGKSSPYFFRDPCRQVLSIFLGWVISCVIVTKLYHNPTKTDFIALAILSIDFSF